MNRKKTFSNRPEGVHCRNCTKIVRMQGGANGHRTCFRRDRSFEFLLLWSYFMLGKGKGHNYRIKAYKSIYFLMMWGHRRFHSKTRDGGQQYIGMAGDKRRYYTSTDVKVIASQTTETNYMYDFIICLLSLLILSKILHWIVFNLTKLSNLTLRTMVNHTRKYCNLLTHNLFFLGVIGVNWCKFL